MELNQIVEMAKKAGARIENWMTNPPRPGLFYMTPEQMKAFVDMVQSDSPAGNLACKSVQKRLATQWGYAPDPKPDGYKFEAPGLSKIDVAPHGGNWKPLISMEKARAYADATAELRRPHVIHTAAPAGQEAEPVVTVQSFTNGSYSRNYKLQWHRDVPEGTKLYAHPPRPQAGAQEVEPAPIDMVLHCPKCGLQHIDEMDEGIAPGQTTGWDNPPHRSHLCHGCNHIWRPADVPTNGVASVKTKGKVDSPIATPAPPPTAARCRAAPTDARINPWRNAVLELIDDCPGLSLEQDRWLSRRVKELDFPSAVAPTAAPAQEAEEKPDEVDEAWAQFEADAARARQEGGV